MENASKALLMAGGILLAILIVALILFARNNITDYYNSKEELKEVDDIANFNLQFSNYENRDVYGYELVSLSNKIADYNFRYGDAEGSKNDKKYNRIDMTIDLKDGPEQFKFNENNNTQRLFDTNHRILKTSAYGIENIIEKATNIEKHYGSVEQTTQLAKSINALVLSQDQFNINLEKGITVEKSKEIALDKYYSIRKNKPNTYEAMCDELLGKNGDTSVMMYYEYYQFKKAIFKCTKIEYDDITGRVKLIEFEYVKLQ